MIAERHIDAAGLDGNILKEVAAFRELSEYTTRMPIEQRAGYLLGLATRLQIDPVDAAAMAADHNPNVMLDRIASHAQQVTTALTDALNDSARRAAAGATEDYGTEVAGRTPTAATTR